MNQGFYRIFIDVNLSDKLVSKTNTNKTIEEETGELVTTKSGSNDLYNKSWFSTNFNNNNNDWKTYEHLKQLPENVSKIDDDDT